MLSYIIGRFTLSSPPACFGNNPELICTSKDLPHNLAVVILLLVLLTISAFLKYNYFIPCMIFARPFDRK